MKKENAINNRANDRLTIVEGEDRLKTEIDFLSKELAKAKHENERLRSVIGNLEPLRDIDWHGKWRIHSCLDALSNKHADGYNAG